MANSVGNTASPLRMRFSDYMSLRGFSPKTKKAYIDSVAGLSKHYNRSPDRLSNEEIQSYLLYLIEDRKLAWSSVNVAFSSLRCFYTHVLKWEKTEFHIPSRPRHRKLPMLLSLEEVGKLIDAAPNLKHRTLLMTVYGAGLRVSEVVRLRPHHIESKRMLIRVEEGKGSKDRYTLLPDNLLPELRTYWRAFQPGQWLFPGQDPSSPMSIATAQKIYYHAKEAAGITRGRGIHTLRHCFATHLVEQGVDIEIIKTLLGHRALETTCKYLHASPKRIASIRSPLDTLCGKRNPEES